MIANAGRYVQPASPFTANGRPVNFEREVSLRYPGPYPGALQPVRDPVLDMTDEQFAAHLASDGAS